ncbi:MAG: phosphotransferase [Verrucomicrobia bacterium]|nr:phosphotransferase [Verrucomicrobiota bacterium]
MISFKTFSSFFLSLHLALFTLHAEEEDVDRIARVATQLSKEESAFASIHKLGGGLTNINYKVCINSDAYFIRCGSILNSTLGSFMEREWACSKMVSEAGLAPRTIMYIPEERILVTDFIDTHGNSVNLHDFPSLQKFCALVRNLHTLDVAFPAQFCPFESIHTYVKNAQEKEAFLPEIVFQTLLPLIERLKPLLEATSETAPCHLDLHHGNVLDDGEKMWLIDWEYAAMGDPYFDLGTIASTESFSNKEMKLLLKAYLQGREPSVEEFTRLYYMRIVADARWALWSYLQSKISPLEFDFTPYGDLFLQESLERLGNVFPDEAGN